MFNFTIKRVLLALSLVLCTIAVNAQVTIGSGLKAREGALLDLRETNELEAGSLSNSTKGLLLPRVKLTDKKSLVDISGTNINPTALTGMIVYNMNDVMPFCKSVYMWNSKEWVRMGPGCATYITGLQDIDFGISSFDTKKIRFKTNSSWRYSGDGNLKRVLSSYELAPNVRHLGGTDEKEVEIAFDITSGDNTPAAGEEIVTKLKFETLDMVTMMQTIDVKRKSPSYHQFKSFGVLADPTVSREGGKITATATSNDTWYLRTIGASTQRTRADLAEEELTLDIPTNETWEEVNLTATYMPYDSNIRQELTAMGKTFAYKQLGYTLNAIAHNIPQAPNTVTSKGGNYDITFKGDYPHDSQIRVIDKDKNVLSTVTAAGKFTEQEVVKSFNIPTNYVWNSPRKYSVQFMKKDWFDVVKDQTQSGFYYILGNTSHQSGPNVTILGNTPLDVYTEVKGDGKVMAKVVLGGVHAPGSDSPIMDLTTDFQQLKYTIPENPDEDKSRKVQVYLATVEGVGAGTEELIFEATQYSKYYFGFIPAAGIWQTTGYPGSVYVELYGQGKPNSNRKVNLIAKSDTGETVSHSINESELTPQTKMFRFFVQPNTSTKSIRWTITVSIGFDSWPNQYAVAGLFIQTPPTP